MDTSDLIPETDIQGGDQDETRELKFMLMEAKHYIESFTWTPKISQVYMGIGLGGVLGVFLFTFDNAIENTEDESLWVIVGDMPSAYLVTEEAPEPVQALEIYCELMNDWAEAVKNNLSLDEVFPVQAPATKEYAEMLLSRVAFIRKRIIPEFTNSDSHK